MGLICAPVDGIASACSSPPVLDFPGRKPCHSPPSSSKGGNLGCLRVSECVRAEVHFSPWLCRASLYLWCLSAASAAGGGKPALGRRSSDGRLLPLGLGLGMLNGGREGLFQLGQQLQQQGEYQAALHCFLSCLLGLSHVQSFTSLPNCLHQVSTAGVSRASRHVVDFFFFFLSPTHMHVSLQHMFNLDISGTNVTLN